MVGVIFQKMFAVKVEIVTTEVVIKTAITLGMISNVLRQMVSLPMTRIARDIINVVIMFPLFQFAKKVSRL